MNLSIGPGALVAAAFIGPGTVTTCTIAGAQFGFALLWGLVFATIATIILQSMAARLGAGAGLGLGEALMSGAGSGLQKFVIAGLVVVALGVGNAAYESGNISGGALGIEAMLGTESQDYRRTAVLAIAAIATCLLLFGGYKVIEKVLIGLVGIMALAFAASVILVRPDPRAVFAGLIPSLPDKDGALFMVIALVGTTVVPYNLFLHAAAVKKRWPSRGKAAVEQAVADTRFSVGLGGLISIFVLSTAAASMFQAGLEVSSGLDMAKSLEPTFGQYSRLLIGIGLLSAGLTSAVTAPMATGFAFSELFGLSSDRHYQLIYKITALTILLIGVTVAVLGFKPTDVILLAQVANGVLLPIIAASLLYAMNRKALLGDYVNGTLSNCLGILVVFITILIGARLVFRAFGVWS